MNERCISFSILNLVCEPCSDRSSASPSRIRKISVCLNSEMFSLPSQIREKYFCLPFGNCVAFVLVFPYFSAKDSENTFSFANLFWLRRNLSGWASRCSASHAASHHRMPWFKLFRNGLSHGKALFISSRYKLRYGSFKLRVFRVTAVALFSPFQIRLESVFLTSPTLLKAQLKI